MYTRRLWYSRLCTAAAYAPGAYSFSAYGPHAYGSALIIHVTRAIELSPEEEKRQVEQGLPIWHLPCHLVFQKGKYRFCHDGRAPSGGLCLNEMLINDLNLMTPLLDPINNLRRFLYAFSTDIEAFFHNIAVDERDRGVFRFL